MFSSRSVCRTWPGTNEFNFGDDPDHRPDPGVRNPHSLDYRKSYQRILMKFYRELGCGIETNCITFWCRSANFIPLLSKSITCEFHYLQIQPPLLPKSIICNFSAPVASADHTLCCCASSRVCTDIGDCSRVYLPCRY